MEFFSNVGLDSLKPSLFELISQEQLRDLLQPALKYVLAVFAQRYPRYLLRIVNKHEEFYAALMLVVEQHYLRKHGASFAEHFYGLKRRRRPYVEPQRERAATGGVPAGEQLRQTDIHRSLLSLVGIPYIRAKASEYYEDLGGGVSADIMNAATDIRQIRLLTDPSLKGWLRRTYKKLYPWLNTAFELWLFIYNIAYLFDKTPYYRPWFAWMGVDIRRLGIEDMRAAAAKVPPPTKRSLLAFIRHTIISSPHLLLDSLRLLLPTAVFFVKFLEWWYSPSSPARSLAASPLGPAIPPPKMLPPHPRGIPFDGTQYGICPLGINNATALPSGYVFCYRCAYDEDGRCPVTLLSAPTWEGASSTFRHDKADSIYSVFIVYIFAIYSMFKDVTNVRSHAIALDGALTKAWTTQTTYARGVQVSAFEHAKATSVYRRAVRRTESAVLCLTHNEHRFKQCGRRCSVYYDGFMSVISKTYTWQRQQVN